MGGIPPKKSSRATLTKGNKQKLFYFLWELSLGIVEINRLGKGTFFFLTVPFFANNFSFYFLFRLVWSCKMPQPWVNHSICKTMVARKRLSDQGYKHQRPNRFKDISQSYPSYACSAKQTRLRQVLAWRSGIIGQSMTYSRRNVKFLVKAAVFLSVNQFLHI